MNIHGDVIGFDAGDETHRCERIFSRKSNLHILVANDEL